MPGLINIHSFKKFFSSGSAGGIVLAICVLLSLFIANSPLGDGFNRLLESEFGYSSPNVHLRYSVQLWINDGLMSIFFLMVGLEIKRELVEGELASPRKAMLPMICAVGGAVVPAMVYILLNNGEATAGGWGIPMATDIAFALALISMLGKKVPASLKIFLAALAIVDDLLAILVIALFYSSDLHITYLYYAFGIFGLLILFNKLGIQNLFFYLIPGVFIWYFIHHSGIHATIAGVLTALAIPTTKGANESPLEKLEHLLVNPVNFIIVPLFALSNTNIRFEDGMVEGLFDQLGLGVILGLILGKPIGILFVSWLGVKTGIAQLPKGGGWIHVAGIGLLAGIGFTMSIFIALLSFTDASIIAEAKFSILVGSFLSGLLGYLILRSAKKQ